MDEIVNQAKINKAVIYYHIGDKKVLYAKVLHDMIDDGLDRFMNDLQGCDLPDQVRIRCFS